MKKKILTMILFVMFVCGLNAQQILEQATVMIIDGGNPAADPYLCVFGNRTEDVTLLNYHLNLDGKEVQLLREREEANLPQIFTSEMERLNVRFMSVFIYQRRFVDNRIVSYWLVDIIEKVGNKYYFIADNRY
jgi:hypothetical protein